MSARYPRLESALELNRLMEQHYAQALAPHSGRPVAWITSGAPVELLRAMGILAVYPENYAAYCGSRGAVPLCEAAEARGYTRDLCSYARTSLGAAFVGPAAPLSGLGRPDLLVASNNTCDTIVKWFEALARLFECPLFVVDAPFLPGDPPAHALAYLAAQLEDLVRWVERTTGHRLDEAGLGEAMRLSDEATLLWREIRGSCAARPSPLNAPDLFVHMAPIVVLRGTPSAVSYYRRLRAEVATRVRQGASAIPNERYRLLWDNIAIWPKLSRLFGLFAAGGACFVADTYTGAWDAVAGPGEPLERLAEVYAGIFLNHSLPFRVARLEPMLGEFSCHGFVMHSNRSCKPLSLGQPAARRRVAESTGLPGLLLEADMCDTRAYADQPIATRIVAFVESLAGRA